MMTTSTSAGLISRRRGSASSPENDGNTPQSNMIVNPLKRRIKHERPTSFPAPRGFKFSVFHSVVGAARFIFVNKKYCDVG